ncbi:MAG: PAS domain S-box protein, partial [Deltaproteobacteria bacterium]|nr:PAS domain S-box protein [Deltaproteobacteria bacterium]
MNEQTQKNTQLEEEVVRLRRRVAELEARDMDVSQALIGYRQSEKRFEVICETISDSIILTRSDQTIVYVNPAACTLLGVAESELVGRQMQTLLSSSSRGLIEERLAAMQQTGRSRVACEVVRKDGSVVGVDCSLAAFYGPEGEYWLAIYSMRNVQDLKLAREAESASEARLRQVIDLVPYYIYVKDQDGTYDLVNQAYAEAMGTTVAALTGSFHEDLPAMQEEAAAFRREDLDVIASGVPACCPEQRVRDARGDEHILQIMKIPYERNCGKGCAVLVLGVDVTELKRSEQELFRSRERIRLLFDHLPLVIFELESTGKLSMWGKYTEKMLGYSEQELRDDLIPQDIHEKPQEAFEAARVAIKEGIFERELNFRRKDGSLFPVHFICVPRKDEEQNVVGMYALALDISERRRVEARSRQQQQQLIQAAKMASLGTLVSGVAHEINNPVNLILYN